MTGRLTRGASIAGCVAYALLIIDLAVEGFNPLLIVTIAVLGFAGFAAAALPGRPQAQTNLAYERGRDSLRAPRL
ncbi:hypothetical protein [Nonomuraea endophytica]|uniref:hypothetical protein n=1 Tax=Nonomuraea endophytica TaxID=714136 RepID=UPI0037C53E32